MVPQVAFPTELWLEVLAYVSSSTDSPTLRQLSLTNHTLCRLTRPLRFSHLRFTPDTLQSDITFGPRSSDEVKKEKAKLEFWCSEQIGPLVKKITLAPRYDGPGWEVYLRNSPSILLDFFFEHLPRFTRVKELDAIQMHFTREALCAVAKLPAIKLTLMHCEVDVEAQGLSFQGDKLDLTSLDITHDFERTDVLAAWTSVLRLETLRTLDLHCNFAAWARDLQSIPHLPHLTGLYLELHCGLRLTLTQVVSMVLKFPKLEALGIKGEGVALSDLRFQGPHIFPALKRLNGPCQLLPILAPGSMLTSLTIAQCFSATLVKELKGVQMPKTVTSLFLEFTIDDLDPAELNTGLKAFPGLLELKIYIPQGRSYDEEIVNPTAAKFFRALPSLPALPPTLQFVFVA